MERRLPKRFKWFVVYREKARGLYADYDLAKSQSLHRGCGSNRSTTTIPGKTATSGTISAEANQRHTDGVYATEDPARNLSILAGWGFLAIHRKEDCIIHQDCNYVHLDPALHGATLRSNTRAKSQPSEKRSKWGPTLMSVRLNCHGTGVRAYHQVPQRQSAHDKQLHRYQARQTGRPTPQQRETH